MMKTIILGIIVGCYIFSLSISAGSEQLVAPILSQQESASSWVFSREDNSNTDYYWNFFAQKGKKKISLWPSTRPVQILARTEHYIICLDPLLAHLGDIIFVARISSNNVDIIFQTPYSQSTYFYFDLVSAKEINKTLYLKIIGRDANYNKKKNTYPIEKILTEETVPITPFREVPSDLSVWPFQQGSTSPWAFTQEKDSSKEGLWNFFAQKEKKKVSLWRSVRPVKILARTEHYIVFMDPLLKHRGNIVFVANISSDDVEIIFQTPYSPSVNFYFDLVSAKEAPDTDYLYLKIIGRDGGNKKIIYSVEKVLSEETYSITPLTYG